MSISVFKTFSAGEVLTAADLNSSFTQIVNNGTDVAFPLTKNVSAGSFSITNLATGVSATDAASVQNLLSASSLLVRHVCDFRLTLTSGTAVTTADVTAATTVYCTPYKGTCIGLYDGSSSWNIVSSAEFSVALGTITSGLPYDVFCYSNAGTATLEILAWTNGTTRATALTLQDGVLVKTGATTRRYLGTFYTTSTTTTEDSVANRYLWNYYNRAKREMVQLINGTWTYTTAAIRQANGSASSQLNFVIGVAEVVVSADVLVNVSNSTGGVVVASGASLDGTSAFNSTSTSFAVVVKAPTTTISIRSAWRGYPAVGRHFLSWNEYSVATGTTTWGEATAIINANFIFGELWG